MSDLTTPKFEPHSEAKNETTWLSSQALDLIKEGAQIKKAGEHIWSDTKRSWSNIVSGKGTLGDFGSLAVEGGTAITVVGAAALLACPEIIVGGGVAAIGAADAVGLAGASGVIGGSLVGMSGLVVMEADLLERKTNAK